MPRKGDWTGVRILGAADVDALLPAADCIEAVEEAFRRLAVGEAPDPGMLAMHLPGGSFHIKAAALELGTRSYFATMANANFPNNRERRALPSIQGLLVLSDAESGTPLAVMDSRRVTELRTAAATAVATRHLARSDANSLALIGCGAQAPNQLAAIHAVRPLSRVALLDRQRPRAERLAAWASTAIGGEPTVLDLGSSLHDFDLVVTCTTSTEPVLTADMVRPGTFVAAIGADSPVKHEIDTRLLAASRVVVDSLEQCATIGELHHAIDAGVMTKDSVHAELGQVISGSRPGRRSADETFVFDSTGLGLQDVAAAALVYERAVASGRGSQVELGPAPS